MDSSVFVSVCYITVLFLPKGYATSTSWLSLNVNEVIVNSSVTFTCSTSSPAIAVFWSKTDKGSQKVDVIGQRWFQENNTCSSTNSVMNCNCSSSTVFKCSIQSVTLANDGQSWMCTAVIDGELINSNNETFKLIRPITSLMIEPTTLIAYPVVNVTSTFICITSISQPGASIQWFNDGVNITPMATYSYNDDVSISVLQYTPSFNDYREGNLSCVASYTFKTYNTVLTANKIFRVQFPVSQPTMTVNNFYTSTTFNIREGRWVHLNCSSTGFPAPSYHWTYPSGESAGALLNITFSRNNGSISCRSFHVMYKLDGTNNTHVTEKKIALNMSILYPPSITRFSNKNTNKYVLDNSVRVLRGDNVSIQCTCDANPPATVYWHGKDINSSTLTVSNIQNDTVWTCQATNSMAEFDGTISTETATQNLSATILYGPGFPAITFKILKQLHSSWNVITDTIRVIEGSTISLMCSVSSVPTSELSWDHEHKESIRTIYNITRSMNTNYTCTANNVMDTSFKGNVAGTNYSSVNLSLLYGPETVSAIYNNVTRIDQVLKVIEGLSFTIVCSASSNPAPRISWFDPLARNGSVLTITNSSSDMNRNVTCRAENTMVDSVGNSVRATSNVTIAIEVLYSPEVQRLQNRTVLLNTSLTVVCNLTDFGNPPASNFLWIKKGTGKVVGQNQTLTINNIALTDEGEYQCTASNKMEPTANQVVSGLSQSTFYINVEYGAHIRIFHANKSVTTIIVSQGEPVELLCSADGDPEPVVRILNTTVGSQSIPVGTEGREAKYRIQQARCEYDTGNYTCVASNIYNEGEQLLGLFVQCKPRASPFSPTITKLYRAPNDSVLFTFTIIAYPKPTTSDFTWFRRDNDSWRMITDDNNFMVYVSNDSMQTWLTIFHVKLADFTDYMVNISNKLGSTVEVFTLIAQSIPDVPTELQVSKTGITEHVVEWIPGFNGGDIQIFTLRYKEYNYGGWIVIPINISTNIWTIYGLKSETKYQIQVRAENKIGHSDWTQAINKTTLVHAVDKVSPSPAIGGAIGGSVALVVIAVVVVIAWRYRKGGMPKPCLKPILTRGSMNNANGAYENIGMVTSGMKNKRDKEDMVSSRPDNESPRLCKNGNKLLPCSSKDNSSSDKHAVKSIPINYNKQSGQSNPQFQQNHSTALPDISSTPMAASSSKTPFKRRDSFSIEHDPIYDNLYKNMKQFKNRQISIQNLRETAVRDKKNTTDVFTEYSALSVASEKINESTNAAIRTANTSKNRYRNMYPYDKNRVILSVIGNDIDTDFINASFIEGYSSPKKYIAAQGPLAGTIADFWRMIWEKNVQVVVMVTNLVEDSKRKCFQYWPTDAANNCQYGDSTIHLLSEDIYADFVVRTLQCYRNGSSKTITHIHFTAWPDKDVPDTALSLLQFWRKVRNVEKPEESPWIVHCSAGVGQTGTFIALDYLHDQGETEKHIKVFDAVLLLREQRINMVQTKNQYLYLHEVLCEALCPLGDVLSNKAFFDYKYTSVCLNKEYMKICQSHIAEVEEETVDNDYIKVLDGEKPENVDKNVDPCVVPDDKYRPVLNMAVNTRGHTDYINAVYLSTFHDGDRLILTQSAKISSDVDFVRLLHDHYVRTVVTLGDQMEPYLPESGETIVIGPYTSSPISHEQKQHFQEYVVRFKHIGEHESFDVLVFRFTNWSKQFDLCQANELLSLLNEVQKRASKDGPVAIQCHDGFSRSGLVAVLWCLMERSKRDGEVAVAETVRLIRRRRLQVISNEAQYRFCHEFMKEYVEGCAVYTNT